jgi:hypothetical protein
MKNEYDEWYSSELSGVRDNETLVGRRLLQEYNAGTEIAANATFAWLTVGGCVSSIEVLAARILSDETAGWMLRCDAMTLLTVLRQYAPAIELDAEMLKKILLMPVGDRHEQILLSKLVNVLLSKGKIWNVVRAEIRIALDNIAVELSQENIGEGTNKASLNASARRISTHLGYALSDDHEKYFG